MKQKAYISMIALLLILLSLSGCARSGTSDSIDPQPAAPLPAGPSSAKTEEQQQTPGFPENIREELETVPDSCMAVLLGEDFFFSEEGKTLKIDEVGINWATYADFDITIKASRFAVVDMDHDGAAEIVLQLTRNDNDYVDASLVLHDQDGIAYGFLFWFRDLRDLLQDGTYTFSGGGRSGTGTLTFTEEGYIRNDIVIDFDSVCGGGGVPSSKVWWYELSEERLAALRELK